MAPAGVGRPEGTPRVPASGASPRAMPMVTPVGPSIAPTGSGAAGAAEVPRASPAVVLRTPAVAAGGRAASAPSRTDWPA